ncbi:hypothetical protein FI667_g17099, partial [Globisporangium splendens]
MEAVAAFVYASGGIVRQDELTGFFETHPEVLSQVYEAAVPARSMKRIVGRIGETHGLSWLDTDPQSGERSSVIAHVVTAKQAQGDVFRDEILWIPRCLDAVERHVRSLPGNRMKTGAIADFYHVFPLESAFMKRRCKGVLDFLRRYDPEQRRVGHDSDGVFCALSSHAWATNIEPDRLSRRASVIEKANGSPTESESGDDGDDDEDDDEYSASYRNLECLVEREVAKSYEATTAEDQSGLSVHIEVSSEDEAAANESVCSRWSTNVSILPSQTERATHFSRYPQCAANDFSSTATVLTVEAAIESGVQSATLNEPSLQPASCSKSQTAEKSSVRKHDDVLQVKLKRGGVKASLSILSRAFNQNKWTPTVVLLAIAQVNLMLNHFRASPVLHPLAFLFIAAERRRQASRAKRTAEKANALVRRSHLATGLVAVVEVFCADTSNDIVTRVGSETRRVRLKHMKIDPKEPIVMDAAWSVEHAMNTLRLMNLALSRVRATPTPHPLAFLFIVHERYMQKRRLEKRARALAGRARQTEAIVFDIWIPKVTLAALSVSSICYTCEL